MVLQASSGSTHERCTKRAARAHTHAARAAMHARRRGDVYARDDDLFAPGPPAAPQGRHADWLGATPGRQPAAADLPTGNGSSPGGGPSPSPPAVTKAGADALLVLLRAGLPSAEILAATTDREYGLLAQKYNIQLPLHLQHLPLLPAPRPREPAEPARVPSELDSEPIKDRPPREVRLRLRDVTMEGTAPAPSPDPAPAGATEQQKGKKHAQITAAPAPEEEDPLAGSAVKERAPSTRRPRQVNPLASTATKERAPSGRRRSKKESQDS
jgi:hypothetical protein